MDYFLNITPIFKAYNFMIHNLLEIQCISSIHKLLINSLSILVLRNPTKYHSMQQYIFFFSFEQMNFIQCDKNKVKMYCYLDL